MLKQSQCSYEFGPFRVDPIERLLLREGHPVPIKAKIFDILLFLIKNHGHLIEKEEVMKALWGGSFVEESNLTVSMSLLRKVLGDDANEQKYIQTVPRKGYRFVGDVRQVFETEELIGPTSKILTPQSSEQAELHPRWRFIWPLAGVLLIAGIASIGATLHFKKINGPDMRIHSLAVLPFLSSGPAGADDYLRLELADVIITRLASTGQITVRPTSAMRQYQDNPANPLQAGRDQKVDAIVTGDIQVLPEQVRVTVQLIRVSDGFLVWADTFHETNEQLFALEDEVAGRVAQSVAVHLSKPAQARLSQPSTRNSNAYLPYLKGRYFWNKRTEEGMRRSNEYFQKAIAADKDYALAYSGLADSYIQLSSFGIEPTQVAYTSAKSAGLRALQLDGSSAEVHSTLGAVALYFERNWSKAEHEFKRSIELDPSNPIAYTRYAIDLVAMGRYGEALTQEQHALELDPLSLDLNLGLGRIYYLSRDYENSIETIQKVIDLDPLFSRAHWRLGIVYIAQRRFSDAINEFEETERIAGPDPYIDGLRGYALARAGDLIAARKILEDLTQQPSHKYVPPYSVALIYVGLNDFDQALEMLNKAYDDRCMYLVYIKSDPLLDSLRSDPRFIRLLSRMGFA